MLVFRLRNRFLFHNDLKHLTELRMTDSAKPRENSCFYKSALVQLLVTVTGPGVLRSAEMGITSAGMQSRDAECGNISTPEWCGRLSRKQRFIISYHLHGRPERRTHKPKHLFQPGWKWRHDDFVVCFLFKPRAAFYTVMIRKMQNINAHFVSGNKKYFQPRF